MISIDVDQETYDRLKDLAEVNGRDVNDQAYIVLLEYIIKRYGDFFERLADKLEANTENEILEAVDDLIEHQGP